MKPARKIAAFLMCACVALAAALAVLPARWLIVALPARWPVAVVDASGTVWHGTALLALGFPGQRSTLPTPISWDMQWRGGPQAEIRHPWLDGPLTLRVGFGNVQLSSRSLRLPASALAQLGAPFNTLKPGGELRLNWPALRLSANLPQGRLLDVEWIDASLGLSLLRPVGHYRAQITGGAGNTVALALSTETGPLILQGDGGWDGHAFHFRGVARPAPDATPDARAALQATLSALGARSGDESILQIGH